MFEGIFRHQNFCFWFMWHFDLIELFYDDVDVSSVIQQWFDRPEVRPDG